MVLIEKQFLSHPSTSLSVFVWMSDVSLMEDVFSALYEELELFFVITQIYRWQCGIL